MLYEIEPISPAKWHPVCVSQFTRTNKAPLGKTCARSMKANGLADAKIPELRSISSKSGVTFKEQTRLTIANRVESAIREKTASPYTSTDPDGQRIVNQASRFKNLGKDS